MSAEHVPYRVVFNFVEKCNMRCSFCYVPFDGVPSGLSEWQRVIDRLAEWGVSTITFGGGDPMCYRDFPDLLRYVAATRAFPFIQLDTNGISLRPEHYAVIRGTVNLVGLPLDGSTPAVHGMMRSDKRHFDIVTAHLRSLSGVIPLKVNTVVSRLNAGDLHCLAAVLSQYSVQRWALYQFWPLDPAAPSAHQHRIENDVFFEAVRAADDAKRFTTVEIGSIGQRHRAYFIVTSAGRAYTIDHDDPNRYVELGSVFNDDVLDRWQKHADREMVEGRARGRMSSKGGRLWPISTPAQHLS